MTDLYKRNNDALRRIAKSSRGNFDSPRTELLKTSTTSGPDFPLDDALISEPDSNDYVHDHDQTIEDDAPPQLGLAHNPSFSDALPCEVTTTPHQSQYSRIFPLSFRFVLLIENYLFLYRPAEEETSVMILKDKIRTMKLTSPFLQRNSQSRDPMSDGDGETIISNATNTTINSIVEGQGLEMKIIGGVEFSFDDELSRKTSFVSTRNSSKRFLKHSDSTKVKPRGLSRRKSGHHTLTSTSSMNTLSSAGVPDGKEELFFALSGVDGRQTITEIQVILPSVFVK